MKVLEAFKSKQNFVNLLDKCCEDFKKIVVVKLDKHFTDKIIFKVLGTVNVIFDTTKNFIKSEGLVVNESRIAPFGGNIAIVCVCEVEDDKYCKKLIKKLSQELSANIIRDGSPVYNQLKSSDSIEYFIDITESDSYAYTRMYYTIKWVNSNLIVLVELGR